ncbi:MAG: thioredoxin fold domain-containing protein [Pseudomonadota bacterium]|nr:thioredoxin fold domain-containing protein [Pseudomonadota bacterium]
MKNLFLVFAFIAFGIFAEKDDMQDLVNKINLILPDGIKVQDISFSDERNLYVINVGDIQPIYMLPDGEHVILGDIFNISEGEAQSTTEKDKDIFRKNKLITSNLETIDFLAKKEKYSLTVFTDVDCGFCRKFHNEIDQYNNLGISIKYLAFPRAGIDSESYTKMVSAWCSDQADLSITLLKDNKSIPSNSCENSVAEQFELGRTLGITGTPALITQSGKLLPGYVPAQELLMLLQK